MANENRIMINLDDESMATLKLLSGHSGLPITTYAKLLIRSGMPAIEPLVDALNLTNISTRRKLRRVLDELHDMQEAVEDGEHIAQDLNDEYQYELAEEYHNSTK